MWHDALAFPRISWADRDAAINRINTLDNNNIRLHWDQKIPGKTWLFDSAASDNLHHSAVCHKQWAERLYGIFNENTTQ
jgi:hypothetical protein